MKRGLPIFLLVAFVAMLCSGCYKPPTYPDIPSIKFVSLTKQRSLEGPDSTTIITISFTDGDGDIGYYPSGNGSPYDDTSSVYYHNFIVSLFQKVNGAWVEDTIYERPPYPGFSGRLPYLTPTGNNKALSGDISMTQYVEFFPVRNDTIHYQVYIYDRALHKSNTITTSDIVITTY